LPCAVVFFVGGSADTTNLQFLLGDDATFNFHGGNNTLFGSSFSKYIVDVSLTWPLILIVSAFAFIFTIIYFFLLKWITKTLIYITILF
jgi:hypothetical protein